MIRLRFSEYTLDEVGSEVGLSGQAVRSIEAKALGKFRRRPYLFDLGMSDEMDSTDQVFQALSFPEMLSAPKVHTRKARPTAARKPKPTSQSPDMSQKSPGWVIRLLARGIEAFINSR